MVQARFRGSRARSTITAHRVVHDERRRAATKIQAVRRGKAARAELQQRDEIQALLQEEEEDDDEDGDDKEELDGSGGEAPWDGGVANLGSRLPHPMLEEPPPTPPPRFDPDARPNLPERRQQPGPGPLPPRDETAAGAKPKPLAPFSAKIGQQLADVMADLSDGDLDSELGEIGDDSTLGILPSTPRALSRQLQADEEELGAVEARKPTPFFFLAFSRA